MKSWQRTSKPRNLRRCANSPVTASCPAPIVAETTMIRPDPRFVCMAGGSPLLSSLSGDQRGSAARNAGIPFS